MSDEITTQERLLKLLYRITKKNSWTPITEIINTIAPCDSWVVVDKVKLPSDEELERLLIEKYGSYIHEK